MSYVCVPDPATPESLWEIAPLALSIVQMGLYISAIDKYKDKLETYADYLHTSADNYASRYNSLRGRDSSFYSYYQGLPGYSICEDNVQRSKGAAFYGYGSRLRQSTATVRGYTPLAKVQLNSLLSGDAISQSAVTRADTIVRERVRQDQHTLERWEAIVSSPVGVESYSGVATKTIIGESFKSLKGFGQGFNSAGALFGKSLYGVLT